MFAGEREIRDGLLTVRVSANSDECLVALDGEVDLANVEAVESAMRDAMNNGNSRVVVDMRDLTFIDSTGIACLVRLLRGDGAERLRFVPSSSAAVLRVLKLTGIEEKLVSADSD